MNARPHSDAFPLSPALLAADEYWIFDGPKIDVFTAKSRAEANEHARELVGDRQVFAVMHVMLDEFCRDATDEFLPDYQPEPDEYPEPAEPRHSYTRRTGMFGP